MASARDMWALLTKIAVREEREEVPAAGLCAPVTRNTATRYGLSMAMRDASGRGGRGGRGKGGRDTPPSDAFALGGEERLQKFLSHSGIDSRRQCEQMILDGRVRVNGKMVKGLGLKVNPRRDQVHVDGNRVFMRPASEVHWYALNKPKGVICTVSDELGRPTAVSVIPQGKEMRLVPVGRLDRDSCGLILLTNENSWINPLTHPSYGHEKTYRVTITSGYPTDDEWKALTNGMLLDGDPNRTRPCLVEVINFDRRARITTVDIMIREGKNRQIRRMFEGIGHDVRSITRVSHGPVRLKSLRPGQWRSLEPWEIEKLKNLTTKTLKRPAKLAVSSRGSVDTQAAGDGSVSSPVSRRSMGHGPFSRQHPIPSFSFKDNETDAESDLLDEEEDEWNSFGPTGEREAGKRVAVATGSPKIQGRDGVGDRDPTRESLAREDAKHQWISPSWARTDGKPGATRRKKSGRKGLGGRPETEADRILRRIAQGEKLKAPAWEAGGRVERDSRQVARKRPWSSGGKGAWDRTRST